MNNRLYGLKKFVAIFTLAAIILAVLAILYYKKCLSVQEWHIGLLAFVVLLAFHILQVSSKLRNNARIADAIYRIISGDNRNDISNSVKDEYLKSAIKELDATIKTLRLEKHRAELVLSNMADGIAAVDSEGIITLFNTAAESIFEKKASEVIGKKIEDADLHPEVANLAYLCINNKTALESEITLPGLPQKVISLCATPLNISEKGKGSAIIILHDLSEVRRNERYQKEFVSNVSHELRTPITAIRTTAEALLMGAKNDEDLLERFLNTILAETDRLSELIEDLLELARRDAGIIVIQKSKVAVGEVVKSAVDIVMPHAKQKNINIFIDIPKELSACLDEMQFIRLVRNLVDNAVKYSPEGSEVRIKASKQKSELVLSVEDNGIGIPHGEVDRIFDRFYRVDKARSRMLGGTGLGLSIVKDIVIAHKGRIDVETQLGKGSKFIVRIPIGQQCDGEEKQL